MRLETELEMKQGRITLLEQEAQELTEALDDQRRQFEHRETQLQLALQAYEKDIDG